MFQLGLLSKNFLFHPINVFQVLDSSGNYAGGFFYGQNIRPSNPEQCNELNDELTLFLNSPPDNSSKMHIVPFFVNLVNAKYSTYVNDKVSNPCLISINDSNYKKFSFRNAT